MAVSDTAVEIEQPAAAPAAGATSLLVCLGLTYGSTSEEALKPLLDVLHQALAAAAVPMQGVVLLFPAAQAEVEPAERDGIKLQPYHGNPDAGSLSVHTATMWLQIYEWMQTSGSDAGLLLGAEAETLSPETVGAMIKAVATRGADLALPRYMLPSNQGLLNQAMLAPLTRALFAGRISFPLALDAGFSIRMAQRMASAAQRVPAGSQATTILWPVDEAALAGFELAEVGNSHRDLPPTSADLSTILRDVAGSLFADIEAKATFWQRTRPGKETLRVDAEQVTTPVAAEPVEDAEIDDLISSFQIGYANLHDIWSLVLPPQTLVSLKRLSQAPRESFSMADAVWVRIVYDFVLAHRLRTLSRGHLLGALAPLYLAWVASHLLALRSGTTDAGSHLSRAFEADRPYLVSRWRWPDRFNP